MEHGDTWVLVCDAGRARLFALDRRAKTFERLEELDNPAGRARAGEIYTDRQGRVKQSGQAGVRKAMAPSTDASEVEADKFAARLGALLQRGYDDHRFERLVLAAPPRFLGRVRAVLSDPLARSVRKSLASDLTRLDDREVRKRIEALFKRR